ncbi:Copia protein [Anthophora quadrimaculata]
METNLRLDQASDIDERIKYRNVIGKLLYVIDIYEDNSGAIAIGKFGNFTKNSKHIEVQYHYVNENYKNGIINIVKIDSNVNLADMLTKSLGKITFLNHRKALRLI